MVGASFAWQDGDPESDIDEMFCLAEELETNFLMRTCVDRLAEVGFSGNAFRKLM